MTALAPLPAPEAADIGTPVDVVIPVYGACADTLHAIHSVLNAASVRAFRLVVIDDASPDPVLRGELESLARQGVLELHRNAHNSGFVASANRGMRLSPTRDVVLLNSDTEVQDGWLDRLHRAAYHAPRCGTATPVSNAATILSYPHPLRDNPLPADIDARGLDRLLAEIGAEPITIPTAIGFCMYIRRDCIEETGVFDESSFGRGYGEENDFCLRAAARGWHHVAAADTFVWHRSGGSFGTEKKERLRQAMATLQRLYPDYHRQIADFIACDPLAPVRTALDAARIRRAAPGRTLHVGGFHPALRMSRQLLPDLRLNRAAGGWRLRCAGLAALPNLPVVDPVRAPDVAAGLLRSLDIRRIALRALFITKRTRNAFEALAQAIEATVES